MRVKPRQLHVREHAAPELHGQEDDVLDFRLQVALPLRCYPYGGIPEQVQCHRDIVGPEAPQGVLVSAHLPQVDAETIQVIDPPKISPLHQRPQPLHRGVKHQQVARQHGDSGIRGGSRDGLGVLHAQGERLFDETRLSSLDALQREPGVRGRR